MAPATVTNATINATIAQANLTTGIDTALLAAGFSTAIATQTGAINRLVYSKVVNAGATKSTVFLEIQITTALAVTARISDNYNTTTFTATNQSNPSTSVTFVAGTNILATSFNHPEVNCISLLQGSVYTNFGIARPANKPSWWDENLFLYCFLIAAPVFRLPALTANPHNYAVAKDIGMAIFADPTNTLNSFTNQAHPNSPVIIGATQGADGYFSADFQWGYSTNTAPFQSKYIQGAQEYTLLTNNLGSASIAIRTL